MSYTSDPGPHLALAESRRVRLERVLQVVSHDFELRFEFGNRDLVGESHIVMKAEAQEAATANLLALKGRALNLLGHTPESWPWYEASLREEAQGKPGFSTLWHALEDARVENQFIQRWPGMARYFDANLLPNLGGRLLRHMPVVYQLELGIYWEGRGYHKARYLYTVKKLLAEIEDEIGRGAHGVNARASFVSLLEIYPKLAQWMRSGRLGAGRSPAGEDGGSHTTDGKGSRDQTPAESTHTGVVPEIETGDELYSVSVSGQRREFPEWYRPGSAPWFERGMGKKDIHPQAVRPSRLTITEPPPGDLDVYRNLRAEIRLEVGFLSHRLTNLIREEVYLRYAGYHRTGRLNKAKLWKQRIGNYRLFQRATTSSSHAVAFTLLVDESASMKGGEKYRLAIKAALLLGETLDSIDAPLEIIGYTTEEYEARAAMLLGLTPAYQYRTTRCSPLEHRIYKRFDEPFFSARVRLTGIEPRHNNWDEESLLFAFHRLQARPERKKIMMVICDGQPNGDASHVIETVHWIESLNCKLVGIGIGADFVRQIYRNAVVVADFRRLAEELLGILAREFRPSAV